MKSLSATNHSTKPFLHLLQLKLHPRPTPSILRHLSVESYPPKDDETFISHALQLLQPPETEWNAEQLQTLLFSDSESPSPTRLLHIARRLDSSSKALNFFDHVRENSHLPKDSSLLASTFQAVLELASREPSWEKRLFELYTTSRERNVPLTINAATLLFVCFGRAGMREELMTVLKGLDDDCKNTHALNRVIDVLLRLGCVDDALHVLDEMLEPDGKFPPNEVTGNAVFPLLLNRDRSFRRFEDEEIIGLVSRFGEHGVFPDGLLLRQLITNFCRDKKDGCAWDVLCNVIKSNGSVATDACNALLAGLARSKDFKKMNELMEKMKEKDIKPNVVTYGILINCLCKSRRIDGALEVFAVLRQGGENGKYLVKPDVIIYNTLIDGLCKVGRQEEGLNLMEQMRSEEFCKPNTVTYNCLIDGFNKVGEIERGLKIFDQMKRDQVPPDVVTLNTLVDGMCKLGRVGSAVKLFDVMQRTGIQGNAFTYTMLIAAFCSVNNINKAMELFDQMVSSRHSADAILYYSLISGLSRAGRMDDASMVVSKLKEAGFCLDIVAYNVLISGFCKKNKLDKAYEMLKDMEETGIKPNTITYNTLISHFCKIGSFETAHKVLQKMLNSGLAPTVVTYGSLINAYCMEDKIEEAMELFEWMSSGSKIPPNTVIYNILIDSLCKKNDVKLALSLMNDMKVRGVKPNTTTYNALFKGLRENNLLEEAFKFMDQMADQSCNPDYITMEVLAEWLSAVGKRDELMKFLQRYEVSDCTPSKLTNFQEG
ncbi:hypothetical protein L484_012912 [Morus notabilis]|uniref:Pentatricopeptide repeat-containing protein n=2 Tax=Morus notabilis TaxID=981085 RepID=W9R1M1_9ROSA|nr:hypothetical protein L484_012912 [Morus notabilis]